MADSWVRELYDWSVATGMRSVLNEHEESGYGDSAAYDIHESSNRSLEERGNGRFSKICSANGNTINTFTTAAYPGAGGLIKNSGRLVYAVTTTGGCLTLGLVKVSYSTIQAGVKVVVEHGKRN